MTNLPDPSPISSKDHHQVMMQTTAEIASLAVATSNLDELLSQVVKRISERFGYYHVAVFLTDDAVQSAVLHAAAGLNAEEIEKSELRIIVGSRSIIGWVAAHNQSRLAADVSQDFFFQKNDLLTETSSEIAIPISARSGPFLGMQPDQGIAQTMKVLGVLDVQDSRENAFDPDMVTVLQTIANHLAAVIQNFRLLETTRRSLAEVSAVYRASSLVSRARNVHDIQDAIHKVLQESQYQAELLLIRPGNLSSEDELVPYQPDKEDIGGFNELDTLKTRKPTRLFLAAAERSLRESLPVSQDEVQADDESSSEEGAGSQLSRVSRPADPLRPYLLLDLSTNAIDSFSAGSLPASAERAADVEMLANYARSLNLVSAAFIPITKLGQLEMLILIGSPRNLLLPEHLQSTISLADLATTAIERLSAMQMMQKRQGVIRVLNVIGHAVSVQTNLQELYKVIYNEIKSLIGDVGFSIALYEPGNEALNTVPTIAIPFMVEMGSDTVLEESANPLGEGLTSVVINTRKPLVLLEDVERRSRELGANLTGSPVKSWLGAPLLVAGDVIGAIVLQDIEQERRFDEDDIHLISTLAQEVAVAIRNSRLLEDLHQRADHERALNEITAQIRASGNAQKILQTATEEVARRLGASRAYITLKTDHGESS